MGIRKIQCTRCGLERPATIVKDNVCAICTQEEQDASYKAEIKAREVERAAMRKKNASFMDGVTIPDLAAKTRANEQKLKDADAEKKAVFVVEEQAAQEVAMRELARRRYLPFVLRFVPKYTPGWLHKDICLRLEKFSQAVANKESPRLMLFCPPRHGKNITHSEPVLTPEGWTTHGELRVGDEVYHTSGKAIKVLALSEDAPTDWVISFSNGQEVRCHENHEWTIYDRAYQSYRTVETNWFAATTKHGKRRKLHTGTIGKRGGRYKYQLPTVDAPLEMPEQILPMDPYTLGAWLGDGSRGKGCITHDKNDSAVIERIERAGYPISSVCTHKDTGVITTYFSGPRPNVKGRMLIELEKAGVRSDKFIPDEYLRSSVDQRLDLLAGLIDTDGHRDKSSRMRFTTADRALADGTMELCSSLGFRPYMRVEQPKLSSSGIQGRKEYYVVGFQPTVDIPCALERKRPTRFPKQKRIGITDVRYEPNDTQGRCIQVGTPDGVYLVGKALLPTHNSELTSKTFAAWHLGHYPDHEFISCSYSGALSMDFSRRVRSIIRDPDYAKIFPGGALDKDSQSVESWRTQGGGGFTAAGVGGAITGKGAHCAYFKVKVPTLRGRIPISEIYVGDKVLGYDHDSNREIWTTVRAVSTQYKPELLNVNGALLTPDHRVWTEESGYVAAEKAGGLTTRMPSLQAHVRPQTERTQSIYAALWSAGKGLLLQGMCQPTQQSGSDLRLWGEESGPRLELQNMLPKEQARDPQLPSVWHRLQTRIRRTREECQAVWARYERVLWSRVLQRISGGVQGDPDYSLECLHSLRRGDDWPPTPVLQQRVLSLAGRSKVAGVFGQVELPQTPRCETRRASVRELREGEGSHGSAPYQPRFGRPCADEPHPPVRAVPQPLSSAVLGTSAEDLAGLLHEQSGYRVVDIQTDTGNFYAEDTLVHNCLLIDDPVKNREEAESATTRQSIKDWYTSTAYTRLAPGGGVLVILTRWHDDDLAGWLLEEQKTGADEWEVIKYPAIAEVDEKFRKKGDALHEERYPVSALSRIQRAVGPRDWEALYQQNPVAAEGEFFKVDMFRMYKPHALPAMSSMKFFTAWDLAIGQKQYNDYSVGITVGIDRQENMWLVDLVRGQFDALQLVELILDVHKRWGAAVTGIEKGQIEMSIAPLLRQRVKERRQYQFFYEELKAGRSDKMARARSVQGRALQGMVYVPELAPWSQGFINECLRFPNGINDDQVDALAWLGIMLDKFFTTFVKHNVKKSWRDKLKTFGKTKGDRGPMVA